MGIKFSKHTLLTKHTADEQIFCYSFSHKSATKVFNLNTSFPRIYVLAMIPGQIVDIFTRTARAFVSPTAITINTIRTDYRDKDKSKVATVFFGSVKFTFAVITTPLFIALQLIIEIGHLFKVIFLVPIGLINPKESKLFYTLSGADRTVPRSTVIVTSRKSIHPEANVSKKAEEISSQHQSKETSETRTLNITPKIPSQYTNFVKHMLNDLFDGNLTQLSGINASFVDEDKLFSFERANKNKKMMTIDWDIQGTINTNYIELLNTPAYKKYFPYFADQFLHALYEKMSNAQINKTNSSINHQPFNNIKDQVVKILEEFQKIAHACDLDSEFVRIVKQIVDKYEFFQSHLKHFIEPSSPSKVELKTNE